MAEKLHCLGKNNIAVNMSVDKFPSECPICHHSIVPLVKGSLFTPIPSNAAKYVDICFQCVHEECGRMFIGSYTKIPGSSQWALRSTNPTTPMPASWPEEIKDISPSFITIHDQAMAAESHELHELTGIGLRKALEFLIKDYAILKNETKAETIKKATLGQCIDKYVNNEYVKAVAKRASWLGNDETHYIRKWDDKDIENLKDLVRLTVNWIHNCIMTEKYTAEMPGPSKSSAKPN